MIKIRQKGDDVLRKIAEEVALKKIQTAKIKNIIEKLKQSIAERKEAVAAAGPQIGESLRVFVISEYVFAPKQQKPDEEQKKKSDYGYLIFINPKNLKKSRGEILMTEECVIVEGVYGTVKRAEKIKVEAYDETGKKFIKSGAGLFAQVIQHEMDHLEGVLFSDKAITLKKYESKEK